MLTVRCGRRCLTVAITGVIGILASGLALESLAAPYIWIAFAWSALCLFWCLGTDRALTKAVLLNLAVAAAALGVAETHFRFVEATDPKARIEGVFTDRYYDNEHPILGYAAIKGSVVNARKYYGETLVYDVNYTIDSHGLRVSPPVHPDRSGACILFFGGSFTHGEGVEDHETLPYQVGVLSGGRHRVYNFGFHGYGPQQMLAAIDAGLVSEIIDCRPDYAIYTALDGHVLRSAGLVPWGQNSPRYVLDGEGGVTRRGTFEEHRRAQRIRAAIRDRLAKSYIYRRIAAGQAAPVGERDLQTFGAIVEAASAGILRLNPNAEFHVLLWAFHQPFTGGVIEQLESRQIRYHRVLGGILPARRSPEYIIGEHDSHPSAVAHALIARYVIDRILAQVPGSGDRYRTTHASGGKGSSAVGGADHGPLAERGRDSRRVAADGR